MEAINKRKVKILDSELLRRRQQNRKYLMELDADKLLLHHRFEAGLDTRHGEMDSLHDGWENPLCQLRGHFLGHWLSAAAIEVAATGDRELLAKAESITAELAKCQETNGGEWCAPIPEKYLHQIANGQVKWAPQYTIHKTLMGLLDLFEYAGVAEALSIVKGMARWFYRWAMSFSEEAFGHILDVETGGMLEIWSQLYGVTKDSSHKELIDRYYRHSLFDGLLRGEDVLTNMHANTTIPEVLGAAKAYEVTGEAQWLAIVKAYWREAVTERGFFCTGGQTNGEVWTPKMRFSARLGEKTQEHCTVYNMMRLADFLFRQTGEVEYADYWERNLYNGVLAQAYYHNDRLGHGEFSPHPTEGLLTYFLPLKSGSRKAWSTKTGHFFCCHGSLVQANSGHNNGIYYQDEDCVYINQFFASDAQFSLGEQLITLRQRTDSLTGNDWLTGSMTGCQTIQPVTAEYSNNPQCLSNYVTVACEQEATFTVKIRIPWWHKGDLTITVNGVPSVYTVESGYVKIEKNWKCGDTIHFVYNRTITPCPLPDDPNTVAFLLGPMVMAGLTDAKTLYGDPNAILIPDNEREWAKWRDSYRTTGQDADITFIPLYQVGYETYTVYFPIR